MPRLIIAFAASIILGVLIGLNVALVNILVLTAIIAFFCAIWSLGMPPAGGSNFQWMVLLSVVVFGAETIFVALVCNWLFR
ncbi:MAG: hypothetical protein A2568_02705 [Candidatus Yanofskybacteria bacterium RIFOXYD1_FULL_44_17]|uniref:Uncharacterized protein n=1 Tax=Candidatus Yanofskybacteria bacterium GW2011_GWE2_40_11 TaxID=1619033 RepID=A0A0G0QU95_9BACT|nr:MAG: hypothetical protein UT69_C0019G0003 [Candidatus Yanofskybacteria bacterium GW2011_GWE1_40_10]KKR40921.1 MAG: hypothetical protein UT75_C0003G0051 [Candidatus Yanofskybacteria bacterium GW2011_GWE2_40_11]KKT15406.1 MAG: hypothetical protein UV97_C0007G0016 [Candidatus Yanofskybacteria bacterium GW2011_GWF2_43_596]OGN35382.1 MAG: hypothetical protein A2207_00105 [Candidatus Yanofskybacteria bacterium RIFOXYA1_FULL_44_17]OGN36528.1 MAG: hypothetical protein A2241_02200 [Candidatus Yanofsk